MVDPGIRKDRRVEPRRLRALVVKEQGAQAVEDGHALDHLDALHDMGVAPEHHAGAGTDQPPREFALVLLDAGHVRDAPVHEDRHQRRPRARLAHGALQPCQVSLFGAGADRGRPARLGVRSLFPFEVGAHPDAGHPGGRGHAGGGHEGDPLPDPGCEGRRRVFAYADHRDAAALERERKLAQRRPALVAGVVVGQCDHVHAQRRHFGDQLRAGAQRQAFPDRALGRGQRHLQVGGYQVGALHAGQQ